MPYSAGVFSLTYDWVTEQASPPIEISKLKTQETDIATGLSNCLLRDGTGIPTAATPWNSQKITGLGNATLTADAINAGQVQTGALLKLGSVSGVDTITASLTPSIAAYTAGQFVVFTPAGTNTVAGVTLNLNSVGAKTIKKSNGIALDVGDLVAAVQAICIYDGTNFVLQNPQLVGTPNTSAREAGFKGLPQKRQIGNYTTLLTDADTHIFQPNGTGAGVTWTIASNASVAYPIGTVIVFVNQDLSNTLAVAIATDTMYLGGSTTTGTRTLSSNAIASATKVDTNVWIISGAGVS